MVAGGLQPSVVYWGFAPLGSSPEEERITSILSFCFSPSKSTLQIQTKAQGLWALGPWRAANPIPAGQKSVWLVAPAGL